MKKEEFRQMMKSANCNCAPVSIKIELGDKCYYFNEGLMYSPSINNGMGVMAHPGASFEAQVSYMWDKAKKAGGYTETKSGNYFEV